MNDTMNYPFATGELAERTKAAKEAKEQAAAIEKMHVGNLMGTESGLWILGKLIGTFEREIAVRDSADESYRRGVQDAVREYRAIVIKHFGHSGLDKILKGK